MKLEGIPLRTPLRLKETSSGDYRIVREKWRSGYVFEVISMRQAHFSGWKPSRFALDKDLTVHKLFKDKDLITSDIPMEMYTQEIEYRQCKGKVLMGGLGLGMAAVRLARMPQISEIVIVEQSPDIIKIVKPQLPKTKAPIRIVRADLFDYIQDKAKREKFDSAYYDIWSSTGELCWEHTVVPLRLLSRKFMGHVPVFCWLEREMIGQVRMSLNMLRNPMSPAAGLTSDWAKSSRLRWTFSQAVLMMRGKLQRQDEESERVLTEMFLVSVGDSGWLANFPWYEWKEPQASKINRLPIVGTVSETGY